MSRVVLGKKDSIATNGDVNQREAAADWEPLEQLISLTKVASNQALSWCQLLSHCQSVKGLFTCTTCKVRVHNCCCVLVPMEENVLEVEWHTCYQVLMSAKLFPSSEHGKWKSSEGSGGTRVNYVMIICMPWYIPPVSCAHAEASAWAGPCPG